jgi:transposase
MAAPSSPPETVHDVVLLARQGMSRRAIARALKVSRNTVREVLTAHGVKRTRKHSVLEKKPQSRRPSKLDQHRGKVDELLKAFPDITAQRIFEELKAAGFAGGYTGVKTLVRAVRPKPLATPSLETTVYGPGEMAENDWSPYRIAFTHAPPRILQGFSYALVNSHRKRYSFHDRSDLHALMDGHVKAFTALDGLALRCKYDSQKPVVLRWEGNQPIYNPRFIAFATHYEFSPMAVRRGHPNDKPRVERSFWELEQSFFNGREFRDEADLNAQLAWWMANVCDKRPQKRSGRRMAIELFEAERPALTPLPSHPYDTARVLYRLCDLEGYVAWDGNWYSLPYEHVTDILPVRVTADELFVYAADLKCIARHGLRRKGAGEKATLPEHRPARAERGPDLEQLRKAYQGLGEPAAHFLSAMEKALPPKQAGFHARRILALRERYDTADLLPALAHAEAFGAFEQFAVGRILLARAKPRRLDEYVAEATARKLEHLIANSSTEPRDLSEYDELPCRGTTPNQGAASCPSLQPNEEKQA